MRQLCFKLVQSWHCHWKFPKQRLCSYAIQLFNCSMPLHAAHIQLRASVFNRLRHGSSNLIQACHPVAASDTVAVLVGTVGHGHTALHACKVRFVKTNKVSILLRFDHHDVVFVFPCCCCDCRVAMTCASKTGQNLNAIWAHLGYWGDWSNWAYCRNNNHQIIAVRAAQEPPQGLGDDTATNAVEVCCGLPDSTSCEDFVTTGVNNGWGSWSSWSWCPLNTAACGLQVGCAESA